MAFSGWQKEARVYIEFGPWQPNDLETFFFVINTTYVIVYLRSMRKFNDRVMMKDIPKIST